MEDRIPRKPNVNMYDMGISITLIGKNRLGYTVISVCDLTRVIDHTQRTAYKDLDFPDGVIYDFNRIKVGNGREKMGDGRILLRTLTLLADMHQFYITGCINPYGWMTFDQLAEWYERYGFNVNRERNFIIRTPR